MARNLQNIRNIGIIAHIDAGKTTLTERMLFYSGAIHRMGDVDKGTTTTDFDPEEQQRGITIYSACVTFNWKDVTINLIDTPGHVDFTAEVERSLRVLDGGVVVFSAREGVEAQSETVWRQADKYGVPRIAFINKMDRDGADFYGTLKEIGTRLNASRWPGPSMPARRTKEAFRGLIDLVRMNRVPPKARNEVAAPNSRRTRERPIVAAPMLDQLALQRQLGTYTSGEHARASSAAPDDDPQRIVPCLRLG
jgi:elongation factor G